MPPLCSSGFTFIKRNKAPSHESSAAQSCAALLFFAHPCGRALFFSPQTQSALSRITPFLFAACSFPHLFPPSLSFSPAFFRLFFCSSLFFFAFLPLVAHAACLLFYRHFSLPPLLSDCPFCLLLSAHSPFAVPAFLSFLFHPPLFLPTFLPAPFSCSSAACRPRSFLPSSFCPPAFCRRTMIVMRPAYAPTKFGNKRGFFCLFAAPLAFFRRGKGAAFFFYVFILRSEKCSPFF